jgi:hypothetical protein
MSTWVRDDTRDWISQIENRIEDIDYYLDACYRWCINHDIYDDRQVFACAFTTCVWVSSQRNETISYTELLEILKKDKFVVGSDKLYDLSPKYAGLDHEELLEIIIKSF